MANEALDHVVPMDDLDDFQVAEGDPDVRGWDVIASDGRKIGEVDDLLVDTGAMKVRYLDVDLDDALAGDDRHVLIPIGYARLNRDDDQILVDTLSSDRLGEIPAYRHGPLTRDYETTLRDTFMRGSSVGGSAGGTAGPDFYTHDAFDEGRFYGRSGRADRRSIAGEL
jgi:sporulation protein YlmC with PRC-barrel domain